MRLAIVGAGIHGLCTALRAANRGWNVCVYDQHSIPNSRSSSADDHRLIRYAYGHEFGYTNLVAEAYPAWERLWNVLGQRLYAQTGTFAISSHESGYVAASVQSMNRIGIEAHVVGFKEAQRLCPHVQLGETEVAMWSASGGVLLARRILDALTTACRQRHVALHANHSIRVDQELPPADCTIWTQGAWSPEVEPSRQVVAYFEPPDDWRAAPQPMVLDLVGTDGFYVVPGVGGTRWKLGLHRKSGSGHPDDDRALTKDEVNHLENAARERLSGLPEPFPLSGRACYYAVAKEDRFDLSQATGGLRFQGGSGHSFKFGALVGELLCSVVAGEMPLAEARVRLAGRFVE